MVSPLTSDAILGLDFLRKNGAIINVKQRQLTIGDNARILTLHYVEGAYQRVRETMGHKLDQQKDYYDKRVHGKPYSKGDLIWLHSCVVLKGVANKLHRLGPAPSVSRRKSLNVLTVYRMCKHPDAVLSSISTASNCALQGYDFQQTPRVIPSSLRKAITAAARFGKSIIITPWNNSSNCRQ